MANIARKAALDEFHWHEALDRAYLAVEWFTQNVESHPAVRQTAELRKRALKLTEELTDFYQAVAARGEDARKIKASRKRGKKSS
jgi:hypothetical protein